MNKEMRHNVIDLKQRGKENRTPLPDVVVHTPKRYPAQAPVRVFAHAPIVEKEEYVQFLSRGQMLLARVVAMLLIPLILVHPIAHVYADEVVDVPPPVETPAPVEVPPTEVPPPSEDVPPAPSVDETSPTETVLVVATDESTAVVETASDATLTPTEEPVDTPQSEPENQDSGTTPLDETNTSEPTPDTPPSEDVGGGESEGVPSEETPSSDTPTGGGTVGGGSTGTEDTSSGGGGSGSVDDVFEDATATTTEATTTNDGTEENSDTENPATDVVPEEVQEEAEDTNPESENVASPISEKSAEELAAEEAYRIERLRAELRAEVEQEFLRGCISFEASGYYCLNDAGRKAVATTSTKVPTTIESVQDAGGDKEIFIVQNGARTQLTNNDWDDTFPSGDASGEHFVWQGMKGGRWQIFTATISASGTPKVSQLTDSRESNFNPKIDGNRIVWQGWADENWEIFMATARDLSSPFIDEHLPEGNALLNVGAEWAVERLTENSEHDMFPSPHGDIVTWQSRSGSDWVVYAYSISAQREIQLSAPGTKGENPRFSLTWEERDQNGNVRLVGYDLATGEKTDITEESLRLPQVPFGAGGAPPETQPDPATLPPPRIATSTESRGDEDNGDNPLLP